MLVAVHQPEHLPWLGYFAKLDASDVFITLDDTQFEKNYFQNRNRIMDSRGLLHWISVGTKLPNGHRTQISDVEVPKTKWIDRYMGKFDHCLRMTPYHVEIGDWLRNALGSCGGLAALNEKLLTDISGAMGISVDRTRSSKFALRSVRSEKLVQLVAAVGGSDYLIGRGSLNYLDLELFKRSAIGVLLVDYQPTENSSPSGVPLSVVQQLCEKGWDDLCSPNYRLVRVC